MPHFDLGTHRLFYQVHNPDKLTNSALVLLHGLGSNADDWMLQQSHFAAHYPTLTVDLRGHGRSEMGPGWPTMAEFAADIASLLRGLKLSAAHVLGLSLGGAVGLQLALDAPDLIKSLTIVNSFARLRVDPKGYGRTLGRLLLILIGRMDWLGSWIAAGIFPAPDQKMWREAAAASIGSNSRGNYLRTLRAVMSFDVVHQLRVVAVPSLIIAGERDTTVAMASKELLAEGIPGAQLVRFSDSGHATPYDAADRFNRVVLRFINEVEGRSSGN